MSVCYNHKELPAIAVCSLCGQDICIHCHTVALNGYAVCRGCPVADNLRPKTKWEGATGLLSGLHGLAYTIVEELSSPRRFFSFRPFGRPMPALAFGYLVLTVGLFVGVIWSDLFLSRYDEMTLEVAKELSVSPDLVRHINVFSSPIRAALVLAIHTLVLWGGLLVLARSAIRFRDVAYIAGYSMAGFAFLLIPPIFDYPVGHLLAVVWVFHSEFTAVQARYDTGFMRGLGAIILPYFILYSLTTFH